MSQPGPPDTDPELLAAVRRILGAPEPGRHVSALDVVIQAADFAAIAAWDRAEGKPPAERLLAAIAAAAEMLEGLAVELAGDQGGAESGE